MPTGTSLPFYEGKHALFGVEEAESVEGCLMFHFPSISSVCFGPAQGKPPKQRAGDGSVCPLLGWSVGCLLLISVCWRKSYQYQ